MIVNTILYESGSYLKLENVPTIQDKQYMRVVTKFSDTGWIYTPFHLLHLDLSSMSCFGVYFFLTTVVFTSVIVSAFWSKNCRLQFVLGFSLCPIILSFSRESIQFSTFSGTEVVKAGEVEVHRGVYYDDNKKPLDNGLLDPHMVILLLFLCWVHCFSGVTGMDVCNSSLKSEELKWGRHWLSWNV